jgi:transcriptional regulator with XRE-family HTH domain
MADKHALRRVFAGYIPMQLIREIRKSKEISQERLALEGGFDRTYISLIERGINSPTIRVLVGLAGVLKVPPSKIVRRMEQLIRTTNRIAQEAVKKRLKSKEGEGKKPS